MQSHKRRILLSGFAILLLSLLAGIAVSFYQWDHGSPFDTSTWGEDGFNPVGRALYPLVLIIVAFPITAPFMLVLLVPVYIGFKKEKLWPVSLIGFLAMGVLWVFFLTELWTMD
jgi:hypothetical protein